MKVLLQLCLVCGVCWLSQIIEAILPFSFPASVIALLLVLALLVLRVVKLRHVQETSDLLMNNLALFFIPVSTGIINYVSIILENGLAFITICLVSLVLTFGATVMAVRLTNRLMQKEAGKK